MRKEQKTKIYPILLLNLAFLLLGLSDGFCQNAAVLVAKGHGFVTYTGNGPLSISGDGSLVVNKNCSVILPETASKTDDVELYIRKNAGIVYPNISGKVQIDGNDIEVSFAGANIGLRIEGNGTVVLEGYGIYIDSNGNAGRWSSEGTSLSISTLETQ
jgi:hypothetical protein